jgi:hypothetical protein
MSLDVYLTVANEQKPVAGERIFVRREGQTVEVTRAEWDALHPNTEPVVMRTNEDDWGGYVYESNITHNLGKMASECGLYEPLWRPEEIGATRACDLIGPLRDGLARINEDQERLQAFNPENGWGDYKLLVRFTTEYLAACERWPEAEVQVSR